MDSNDTRDLTLLSTLNAVLTQIIIQPLKVRSFHDLTKQRIQEDRSAERVIQYRLS